MYNEQRSCMILFSTSTSLQRAQRALANAGIKTRELRPPSGLTGGSCAYALSVNEQQLSRARKIISDIPHGGVYIRTGAGYREI